MVLRIIKAFGVINLLFGMAMILKAVWPTSADPALEKSPLIVIISVAWALLYCGIAYGLFYMKHWARILTIAVYAMGAVFTLGSFAILVLSNDRTVHQVFWIAILVYLFFFVLALLPIIFMMNPKVKEAFTSTEEGRTKAEEDAARATFRRRR